jgi:hypothetical protein
LINSIGRWIPSHWNRGRSVLKDAGISRPLIEGDAVATREAFAPEVRLKTDGVKERTSLSS